MNGPRKTYAERIALERERQQQSKIREADIRARQRKEERTLQTRRKVLLGVAVLKYMGENPGYHFGLVELGKIVRAAITEPRDQLVLAEFFPEARPERGPRDGLAAPGELEGKPAPA